MSQPLARPGFWVRLSVACGLLMSCATILCAWPTPARASLSCVAQTGAVAFGTYDPAALLSDDTTGYVEMKCTCTGLDCLAFGYSIGLDSGASGNVSDRRLRKTGQTSGGIMYGLYRDLTRLLPWDNGSNKLSGSYLLSGFGTFQRTLIYGRIPAGQVVSSGGYSDTVGVTITF